MHQITSKFFIGLFLFTMTFGAKEIQLISAVNATTIAEYRFDECYYNGTAGEVEDSIDGDNNGTLNGSIDISSHSKVCNSAEFSGGAVDIDNLDVNSSAGAKTTVSFWMYWNGKNSVMPFGWQLYDLWFYSGSFGFNSGNGDIYGISSAGLANAWHHVSAVFTNGDMVSNKLYIDGVEQSLTQRRNSPNNSRTVVQSSARIGGWLQSGGYRFSGNIDELNIYKGELDSAEVNQIMNATHSCKCPLAVGSWNLDECFWNGSNDEVEDSSIHGYHGTALLGATTQKSADAGGGICHVGLFSNNYVSLTGFPHLTDSRSIVAWFKTTNRNERGQRIFADDEHNNNGSYALSVGDPGAGKVRFYIRGLNATSLDSASVVQNNQWYFAAAIFDASTMKKRLIIYDDSGTVLSDVQATVSGSIGTPTGTPSIGGETSSGETANRFSGNIDEVKVYDTALNDSQIQSLMGMTHSCSCAEAIANYPFDECSWLGTSGEVGDRVMGDNNGTISGLVNTSDIEAKVCKSAFFSGGSIQINDLDVDTTAGATTSVAFWMYWDGSNSVMPFGWKYHDLWFYGGNFGFNSASGDIYGMSSSGLANGWHHVAAIFTNGDIHSDKLYIDGVQQSLSQVRNSPNNSRAVVQSSARIGGWLANNGYRFKGYLDELYIYKGTLRDSEILNLMNETHPCSCIVSVNNYRFDAWDIFRNINDRNISTKIVNKEFDLTIASLNESNDNFQEFNGTVCASIVSAVPSVWMKSDFRDNNTTLVDFNVSNAIQDTKVEIRWWKDTQAANVTCNDGSEDNSTLSSDNFAVRPKQFNLTATGPYYAGEDFNVIAKAYDENLNNAADYNETQNLGSFTIEGNETRLDCQTGAENFSITDADFSNGVTPTLDANFTGLATYLNIKIYENNGSEFAKADVDDTPDSIRLIEPYDINITVLPYELNVTLSEMNASTQANWLYMADVNDMNLSLHVSVQANNKEHEVLKDFNSSCYAQDVDLEFDATVANGDSALDMNYTAVAGTLTTSGTTLGDIDQSMRISSSEFVDGVGDASYALNAVRSFETPIAPFSVSGLGATITSSSLAKEINNDTDLSDGTFAFYYGRVLGKDVKVMRDVTNPLQIEVYKRNDLNASGWRQNSLNWYQNQDHSSAIFGDVIAHSVEANTNFVGSSDANVNATINPPSSGVINVDISTTHTNSVNRVFHLDVDRWLWYMPEGFGKDYKYQAGSSNCQEHPCFNYTFKASDGANEISSGNFSGSDVVKKDRGNYIKKGIKVFR